MTTEGTSTSREQTMKILLISPASGPWRGISRKRLFSGKMFRFSMLSLLTVAELSPDDADIRIIDEQVEPVPEDEHFDLVGITAMTAAAPRAYTLARRFRERGIPVVLGGFHATLNPEEARQHVDAVVVGCAAGAWERLIEDLRAGALKPIYRGDPQAAVPRKLPRRLIQGSKYVTLNATYATLGCTNRCRFCAINTFHKGRRHHRPVQDVIDEVAAFDNRFFMFVDDNLTQDRDYARALLTGLAPLNKIWITQASIDIADDDNLLRLMREAGCIGIFIGLETFNDQALGDQGKGFNAPSRYREAVAKLHRHGMFVESGIVFGFDTDGPEVFRSTLAMLEDIGIDAIQASILTPLPGTPLFDDMKGRITDTDWEHYDYRHAVFTPKRMTAADLQAGADWVIRKYYSPLRILKRALRWITMPHGFRRFIYPLALNFAYYGRVKTFAIRGHDPGTTPARATEHALSPEPQ
jgi:radical SAM superfamily enzyme YgiQ (UPF0313 family)